MMKLRPELKNVDVLFAHKKWQITALRAPCASKALSVISHTPTQWLITLGPWRKSAHVASGVGWRWRSGQTGEQGFASGNPGQQQTGVHPPRPPPPHPALGAYGLVESPRQCLDKALGKVPAPKWLQTLPLPQSPFCNQPWGDFCTMYLPGFLAWFSDSLLPSYNDSNLLSLN